MKTFIVVFAICSYASLYAQNFVGQVLDLKTNDPIPYVNIGIKNKGVGTLSDENGNFSLKLDEKYNEDSLIIIMLGYKTISLKVNDAKSKYANVTAKFYLEENSYKLNEVVIRPINFKTTIVGNKDLGQPAVSFYSGDTTDNRGFEVGTLIHIKKRPTYIDNISFGVVDNDFDSLTIRLNIYDKETNTNLLQQPIYVTVKKGDKTVTVDTKKYTINVQEDFIIAFEALEILQTTSKEGKTIGKKFSFSGGLMGSDMLLRENIYDEWEKIPVIVVGFNATITYEDEGNWISNFFN